MFKKHSSTNKNKVFKRAIERFIVKDLFAGVLLQFAFLSNIRKVSLLLKFMC